MPEDKIRLGLAILGMPAPEALIGRYFHVERSTGFHVAHPNSAPSILPASISVVRVALKSA